MMSKAKLYECGPIREDCQDDFLWRDQVSLSLSDYYQILSPIHGRKYREGTISWQNAEDKILSNDVFHEDTLSIRQSDIILANLKCLGTGYPALGSLIEIGMGIAWNKLIVVVADIKWKNHPFLDVNTIFKTNLGDAIDYLAMMAPRFSNY